MSKDGTQHDGMWVNDIRHGLGEMTYTKTGNRIQGTWESDRLNGEATIINKGKDPKPCVFKMDLAIGQDDQGVWKLYAYVGLSILLALGIYCLATVIAILGVTGNLGGKEAGFINICILLYIVYVIITCCCTDQTAFAGNCTTYSETLGNVKNAIEARPVISFNIECYHMETEHYKDSDGRS